MGDSPRSEISARASENNTHHTRPTINVACSVLGQASVLNRIPDLLTPALRCEFSRSIQRLKLHSKKSSPERQPANCYLLQRTAIDPTPLVWSCWSGRAWPATRPSRLAHHSRGSFSHVAP